MEDAIVRKETCNVEIFNLQREDYEEFKSFAKEFKGNSFAVALKELLRRREIYHLVGLLSKRVEYLEERIERLEPKTSKKPLTFGGRKNE